MAVLSSLWSLRVRFLIALHQFQRRRVDAIAQARRLRSVVEDVAQMGVAAAANHFGTQIVTHEGYVFLVNGLPVAWPAGVGFVFRLRIKERLAAADAGEDAVVVVVAVFAGVGTFGP